MRATISKPSGKDERHRLRCAVCWGFWGHDGTGRVV
jgi:hypothetical protein